MTSNYRTSVGDLDLDPRQSSSNAGGWGPGGPSWGEKRDDEKGHRGEGSGERKKDLSVGGVVTQPRGGREKDAWEKGSHLCSGGPQKKREK